MTDALTKRRNLDTEGRQCEVTGRRQPCDWSDAFTSQRTLRIFSKHQKLEEAKKDPLLEPSEREHVSADTLILDF